ncbi:hypothetical protein LTR28_011409 [Elasticomyces elasticus]|nr:hypothetical protein LTR28_011409 [Elasticomyces elasticus]
MTGSAHAWTDLPQQLSSSLSKINSIAKDDGQLKAFTTSNAIDKPETFGIKAAGSNNAILVKVSNGKAEITTGSPDQALFTLSALPEQWENFFKQTPEAPYQSYWGMFGMNIKQEGIEVLGSQDGFAHWTHVWRRVLEILHDAHVGETPADTEPEVDEDHIVGRYVYIKAPVWGRCKVFYEQSGTGDLSNTIVFLHTAGSDGRQYHGVLNDERMRKKMNMIAFDLPAHGRSFPYEGYWPGMHTNTEDSYVGCIAALVKKLGLKKPIICGASMAGQVCLAVAARADEVGAGGTIPLQGSDYLNMERQWYDRSPYVNQSLFNPEWVYGVSGYKTRGADLKLTGV